MTTHYCIWRNSWVLLNDNWEQQANIPIVAIIESFPYSYHRDMFFPIIYYSKWFYQIRTPEKMPNSVSRILVRYVRWCFLYIFQVSNFWAFFFGVAIWDNHTCCVKFSQNPPINQASGWFPAASLRSTPPSALPVQPFVASATVAPNAGGATFQGFPSGGPGLAMAMCGYQIGWETNIF